MMKRKLKTITKKEPKEELEIIVDVLGGNEIAKFTNEMMHSTDMFELYLRSIKSFHSFFR